MITIVSDLALSASPNESEPSWSWLKIVSDLALSASPNADDERSTGSHIVSDLALSASPNKNVREVLSTPRTLSQGK